MLEDRADLYGELLSAVPALPQAVAHALSGVGGDLDSRSDHATVRALGPVLPDNAFQKGEGRFFIPEVRAVQDAHGGLWGYGFVLQSGLLSEEYSGLFYP